MSCPFKHLHTETLAAGPLPASETPTHDNGTINKLVTFMQGSPDAAFLLDREGKIVYRNKAAQLMFLTNVHQMSLCSLFSLDKSSGGDSWDNLAKCLTSEPKHYDATVEEQDGTELGFRLNLVKLPPDLMGDGNKDVFACAYVIPAHDNEHVDGVKKTVINTISEGSSDNDQLRCHMKDVLLASLDTMFCLKEDGTISMANDPAVHLFGYSHEELIGKDIASICPMAREVQNILNFMHAPSINKKQITTATDKSGNNISIELGLSLNQSFAGSSEPVYFAHMKDLTAFAKHEKEIVHRDDMFQEMINSSFDSMFAIDQRGKILVVNDAACQAFGYARAEFLDQNISMVCNERDGRDHDKYLRRYINTGERRVIGRKRPLVAKRKDGTEFHIELGVSEVLLPSGEKMFCGYVRDRTQERMDKQNLRRKEAVIQDKFFDLQPGDARGSMKKLSPPGTEPKRHTVR